MAAKPSTTNAMDDWMYIVLDLCEGLKLRDVFNEDRAWIEARHEATNEQASVVENDERRESNE